LPPEASDETKGGERKSLNKFLVSKDPKIIAIKNMMLLIIKEENERFILIDLCRL